MSAREQFSDTAVVPGEVLPCVDPPWLGGKARVRRSMPDNRMVLAPDIAEIPKLIAWVETCCHDSAVARETALKLVLALEEATVNVIQHGFDSMPEPHHLEVQLDIAADRVIAAVIDNGRPFDPSTAPEPDLTLPLEQRDLGGLGILFIHRMVDRIEYRHADGHNRLRLEKARG